MASVPASNGTVSPADSVVLASAFFSRTLPVTIRPRAVTLRFLVLPTSSHTFALIDATVIQAS
jgi:hypothetical protein